MIAVRTQSVVGMFVPLMLLLALRLLVRKNWIAVVLTSMMGVLAYYPGVGSPLLYAASFVAPLLLFWNVLFRFGLLGLLIATSVGDLLRLMPMTFDLSAWYAAPSVLTLLVVMGLSLFAFRSTLAGRPVLRAQVLGEAPAR